jgi:hypothetical protein
VITFAGGHQVLTFTDRGIGLIVCPVAATGPAQASGHAHGHGHDHGYGHGQDHDHGTDGDEASGRAPEWDNVLRRLRFFGWELVREGGGDGPRLIGATPDGRPAYELFHCAVPPLDAAAAALAVRELCQAAAVVRLS